MRFEDLSPEDQRLLQTDLGDFDKMAAERLDVANEMYEVGFAKLAAETAEHFDEMLAQQAEHLKQASEEEDLDDESEKYAEEYGAFIERGFFDGLRKLGADRHGSEWFYLMPFIEEKVAQAGAEQALEKFAGRAGDIYKGLKAWATGKGTGINPGAKLTKEMRRASLAGAKKTMGEGARELKNKVTGAAGEVGKKIKAAPGAVGGAAKGRYGGIWQDIKGKGRLTAKTVTTKDKAGKESKKVVGTLFGRKGQGTVPPMGAGEKAKSVIRGVGKLAPEAALAGGVGTLGYKALSSGEKKK